MKFTPRAIVGLSLIGLLSGCSETDTTVSVNVRYWTDFLDATSFKVSIEQEGQTTISEPIVPRDLGDGKFDVVCDHDWELPYCRFYKRFDVSGWAESDVTVTFSGKTNDGTDIEAFMAANNLTDELSKTFELEANEVNVVYIQLPNVKPVPDPVSPGMTSDTGSSGADAGSSSNTTADGGTTTDPGSTDASVPDAGSPDAGPNDASVGDAAVVDPVLEAGTPDAGDGSIDASETTSPEASVLDGGEPDAAVDADDASVVDAAN